MKTEFILVFFILIACLSCATNETKPSGQNVSFGIYEIINSGNTEVSAADTFVLPADTPVKILKTNFTVDPGSQYKVIVAVRSVPSIDNSAIQKAKQVNNSVEIHFNLKGAKAWADMTRNNAGKKVAFVINDEICAMPYINAEIRSGMARIDGFESAEIAGKTADALNAIR